MENIFSEEAENTVGISKEETDIPKIDPKDPFENFTEYKDYNSDYREIVPQIDIPGCVIPFAPSKREKKRIRHYFNAAGAGILIDYITAFSIINILIFILERFIMKTDGISSTELTKQYLIGLNDFINGSSIGIGLCAMIYPLCHALTFFIGSKATKIKISSYFQTKGLTIGAIFIYFLIGMLLRIASGTAILIFSLIFENFDNTVGIFDYQSPKAMIITILYGCILAPITEELIYRGFLLKNLSRVSQRFGIMSSALIFGLVHGNFTQFFMAFIFGILLAYIDIKHNSLLPSIIIHAASNSFSFGASYSGLLNNLIGSFFISMGIIIMAIAGAVLLIIFYKKNRLPYTMPHQKLRNGTAISSVLLVAAIVMLFVITVINSFPSLINSIS